jgi:hypothetical protein
MMSRRDLSFVGWSVFVAATALAYAAIMILDISVLRYYPLEHAWHWGARAGVPSQGWYGHQVFALAIGAAGGLAARFIGGRMAGPGWTASPRALRWCGIAATAAVVASMAYTLYHEFHQWHVLG